MREETLISIIERCSIAEEIVIVGAGNCGKRLYEIIKDKKEKIKAFFDNDNKKIETKIGEVVISKPYNILNVKCLYIIAVANQKIKNDLFNQLIELGIKDNNIVAYNDLSSLECIYKYVKNIDEKEYPKVVESLYYQKFGRRINLDNPKTYNEIINWEKLYLKEPIRTELADKVKVRDWVKERIGDEHLTKRYGLWDDPRDINFDELPSSFVLKLNNGSGRNILVKDKSKLDIPSTIKTLNEWKNINYAFTALELHYKDIVPKIICEEYLKDLAESVYDYNIYCFHGEPKFIWCIKGSHRPNCQASFYDLNWEMQPFSYGYPKDEKKAPKPEKLDEMLELSRVLCKQFKHVRVDWYSMPDGRVLFGEMTFTTWAGLNKFTPEKYDLEFGKLINSVRD